MKRARLPVSDDGRSRGDEGSQFVQFPLRPQLLPDPDPRVHEDDSEKERVAPITEDERQNAEGEENRIEWRDRIRPDDCRRRSTRGGLVRLAPRGVARCRLPFGQACCGHRDEANSASVPPGIGFDVACPSEAKIPSTRRVDVSVRLRAQGDLLLTLDGLGCDRE